MSSYYTAPYGFQTSIASGWGAQFYPQSMLSSVFYDIPSTILYTFYPQEQYDVWLDVPVSVAQQFNISGKQYSSSPSYPNPDTIYNTNVVGKFPQCILTENGSPLLCENGVYLVI